MPTLLLSILSDISFSSSYFIPAVPMRVCLGKYMGHYMMRLGQTVERVQLLNIDAQIPSIKAKGCM